MSQGNSLKAVVVALFSNAFIALIKFIVAFITTSAAMMAEAIHSTADCMNQIFLLIGSKRTKKVANEQHSFGYGKEEYFWGFIVATLLFFVGGGFSIYEGIHKLFVPEPIKNVMLSFIVLGIGIVLEFNSFRIAYNQFKIKNNSSFYKGLIEVTDTNLLVILLEDFAALLGLIVVLITTILAFTIAPIFDAIGSILVGAILISIAYMLSNELRKLIVGESIPREIRTDIKHICSQHNKIVKHVNKIQTMFIGREKFVLLISLDVYDNILAYDVENIIEHIKLDIIKKYPNASVIYIEVKDMIRNNKI